MGLTRSSQSTPAAAHRARLPERRGLGVLPDLPVVVQDPGAGAQADGRQRRLLQGRRAPHGPECRGRVVPRCDSELGRQGVEFELQFEHRGLETEEVRTANLVSAFLGCMFPLTDRSRNVFTKPRPGEGHD